MWRTRTLLAIAAACFVMSLSTPSRAARVSTENAGLAARNFIVERFPADSLTIPRTISPKGNSMRRVSRIAHLEKDGNVLGYLVRLEPQGFVLFSTDDQAPPVRLYSRHGSYESLPPGFRAVIENELLEDQAALAGPAPMSRARLARFSGQWKLLLDAQAQAPDVDGMEMEAMGDPNNAGMALVATTWDQGDPYNYYCPAATGGPGGKAWAGCGATALAQILRHHRQPLAVIGSHSYFDSEGLCTGTRSFSDAGTGAYAWSTMPLAISTSSSTAEKMAVGQLIYHCAVALDMDFEADGSSASPVDAPAALADHFGYSTGGYRWKSSYTSAAWYNMLAADINQNRPVLYAMWVSGMTYGHILVCDGFRNGNEMHLNMGWGGDNDAWYNIDSVSAEGHTWTVHGAVFGISCPNYTLDLAKTGSGSVRVNGTLRALPWSGTFAVGAAVTLEAVPDGGYVLGYWSGDLSGNASPTSIVMNGYKSVTANFTPPFGSLKVDISPDAAAASGAWRRLGTSTWYAGGQTESIAPAGTHTVEFKDILGWTKPANIAGVSVSEGALTTAAAYYTMNHEITIGTGTGTWEFPLMTNWHDARTQSIYLASEIGGQRTITGLALDVTTIPGMAMSNFTIRMKPTVMANYNASHNFETTGWKTVYQAYQTVTSTGWKQFSFSTPFDFNYTDGNNVMVDISFNNSDYHNTGYCRNTATTGQLRVAYNLADSTAGDPLTWSGPAPYYEFRIPNIRLTVTSSADANRDFSVNFTDLAVVASKWQQGGCSAANQWCAWADVNRSGSVNYADIFELANHWLE